MTDTLSRLFGLLRDSAGELTDAVLGDRAERLLDDDIRALDAALHAARSDYAAQKAARIALERQLDTQNAAILTRETSAESLLVEGHTQRARALAAEIVQLQTALTETRADLDAMLAHESAFSAAIVQLEAQLRRTKHQLDTLRATTSLQRAQAIVAKRKPGPADHPEPATASAWRMRAAAPADADSANGSAAHVRHEHDAALQSVLARLQRRAARHRTATEPATTPQPHQVVTRSDDGDQA